MKKVFVISLLFLVGLALNVTASQKHLTQSEIVKDVGVFDVSKIDLQNVTPVIYIENTYQNCEVFVIKSVKNAKVYTIADQKETVSKIEKTNCHYDPGSLIQTATIFNYFRLNCIPENQKIYILNCSIKQC